MNAYHNLAGWLRDVRAVLGDRTELADSYYWQLRDLVEEILPELESEDDDGGDVTDAEELLGEDADDDVAVLGPRDGLNARAIGTATRAGRARNMGGSPGLGDASPRSVRGEARRQPAGDTALVAGAGCQRVAKAVTSADASGKMRPVETRSVPRGTQSTPASLTSKAGRATRKKGGKRGANATTKRRTRR